MSDQHLKENHSLHKLEENKPKTTFSSVREKTMSKSTSIQNSTGGHIFVFKRSIDIFFGL